MKSIFPASLTCAIATVCATATVSLAAPFLTVSLEARKGADPFSSTVAVDAGDTLDYRVTFRLADVGTTNTNPSGTTNDTINSYSASPANGLNNIKMSVSQTLAQQIQLDFAVATADTNFAKLGSSGGTLSDRGNGSDNLLNLTAAADAGQFFGVPTANTPATTLLFSGTATVSSLGNGDASSADVGILSVPTGIFLGMRYNGTIGYNGTTAHQNGAQPVVQFVPLTLTAIPEPTTLSLLGLTSLVGLRRRRG